MGQSGNERHEFFGGLLPWRIQKLRDREEIASIMKHLDLLHRLLRAKIGSTRQFWDMMSFFLGLYCWAELFWKDSIHLQPHAISHCPPPGAEIRGMPRSDGPHFLIHPKTHLNDISVIYPVIREKLAQYCDFAMDLNRSRPLLRSVNQIACLAPVKSRNTFICDRISMESEWVLPDIASL
jgi:hypothetical protein